MSFDELCPNCARKLTKRDNTFFCIACEGKWTEESLKLANERLNIRKPKENEVKSLSCPSCGGNFLVSDLTDNDEFVTCTKCKKVFLTSDIYSKDQKKQKIETELLKNERENIEKERRKIEQERMRLEKERSIKEAQERLNSIIGNQSSDTPYNDNNPTYSKRSYSFFSRKDTTYKKPAKQTRAPNENVGYCNKWVTLLLCYFLGFFGAHKFYEGNKKWGIIYLCTLGFFGYGWLFDLFRLAFRILFGPTYYPKR